MKLEEFNKLNEKTKRIVLEEALELYDVVVKEKITIDMVKLTGKICTYWGYGYDDLYNKLIPSIDEIK